MEDEEEDGSLTAAETVMLVEALDALLGPNEEGRSDRTRYQFLRRRLKQGTGISFFHGGSRWLETELSRERDALTEKLFAVLSDLLRDPKQTRSSIRQRFASRMRQLREERQSTPRPGIW